MLLSAMFYATSNGTAPSERTTVYTDAEREAAAENSILDTYAPGTNVSN
jgi:hypothetical protein